MLEAISKTQLNGMFNVTLHMPRRDRVISSGPVCGQHVYQEGTCLLLVRETSGTRTTRHGYEISIRGCVRRWRFHSC